MGVEYGGKEQQQEHGIDHVGKRVEEAVVGHKQAEAQRYGCYDPHYLHTRARRKAEDVGVAVCVACTTHTNPSEDEQCYVDSHRPPVERLHHSLCTVILTLVWHLRLLC